MKAVGGEDEASDAKALVRAVADVRAAVGHVRQETKSAALFLLFTIMATKQPGRSKLREPADVKVVLEQRLVLAIVNAPMMAAPSCLLFCTDVIAELAGIESRGAQRREARVRVTQLALSLH